MVKVLFIDELRSLGRITAETLQLLGREFPRCGVQSIIVREEIDTAATGRQLKVVQAICYGRKSIGDKGSPKRRSGKS